MVTDQHDDGPRMSATWSWPVALLSAHTVDDLARTWWRALGAIANRAVISRNGT